MKLRLTVNGAETAIDLLAPAPECRFRVDSGTERRAQVEVPVPGVYSVLMTGAVTKRGLNQRSAAW